MVIFLGKAYSIVCTLFYDYQTLKILLLKRIFNLFKITHTINPTQYYAVQNLNIGLCYMLDKIFCKKKNVL